MDDGYSQKIVRLSELLASNPDSRYQEAAALCYGSFNVIHSGHLRYFERAISFGNQLHIAVQGDQLFENNQLKIQFNEQERAEALAALGIVTRVIILDEGQLEDLVKTCPPKALVLGKEFEEERSEQIVGAIEFLKTEGIKVTFGAGEVQYASVDLFHHSQLDLVAERLNGFPDDWTLTETMPTNFRYFCMGNALVVPLVGEIMEGIKNNS